MSERGKKVLDIDWEHEGVRIKIPVKAFTNGEKMTFRASHAEAGIDEESPDINVIRQAIEKKLREWYKLDWTLYMLVTISGDDASHKGHSFNVKFETEFYVIGTDVRGTERYMRVPQPHEIPASPEHVNVTRWSGEHPCDGRPKTGKCIKGKWDYGRSKHGITTALVKATPENVRAADNFVKAMERLLLNMHDFFSPEKVLLTFAGASQLLLPAQKIEKRNEENK